MLVRVQTVRLPVTSGSSSAPALFVSKSMLHSQGYGNASNEDALANTMIQLRQLPQPSPREDAYEEPAAAHDCLEFDLTDAGFSSEQSLWEEQRLLGINKTVNGTLEADEYHFFHLCIIKHTHHHEITIQAISITGLRAAFRSHFRLV